jgi:hypothetical protein
MVIIDQRISCFTEAKHTYKVPKLFIQISRDEWTVVPIFILYTLYVSRIKSMS